MHGGKEKYFATERKSERRLEVKGKEKAGRFMQRVFTREQIKEGQEENLLLEVLFL